MAKKKANNSWLPPADATESAAKESIEKTTKPQPRAKSKPKPVKKKVGRPRALQEETIQVQVSKAARDWAKKVSVMEGTTMIEYLTALILKDAKDRGYLK